MVPCLGWRGRYSIHSFKFSEGIAAGLVRPLPTGYLADAESGMTLKVTLRWEGMEVDAPEYSFSSDLMALYADKIQKSSAYALLLRVSGAEGKTLTVTPSVETLTRMNAQADTISHTVESQA